MRTIFLSLLFAAPLAQAATPAALSGYSGFDDCRIAPLEPAPLHNQVNWNGACKEGFAVGAGELSWRDADKNRYRVKATLVRGEVQGEGELKTDAYTYTGTLLRGIPHGTGFFTFTNGDLYEGEVANGKFEGKGISITAERNEYTGEWKDNKRHGRGEIKYGLGGSYSGQWQEGKRHGQGRLVYAGSGRSYEGRFENDLIAGTVPRAGAALDSSSTGWRSRRLRPFDLQGHRNWEDLTEAQKNTIRNAYPALEMGDDPPYFGKDFPKITQAVHELNTKAGTAQGTLLLYTLVGADGKAKQVNVYQRPTLWEDQNADKLFNYIASLMMMSTYKPAKCQGKPCEMMFPLKFEFYATH